MFEVTVLGILAVSFAYLNSYKEVKYGLKISFVLIFFFLAFRYDFGNDYMGYYQGFLDVNRYQSINYFDITFHFEPGWLFLCRLFKPVGFFGLIIFLSLFNCIVYYRFIARYIPINYYWLAVFIYICDPSFMLIQASAMRQSVSIALFLCAIPYIYKKDIIRYSILIGIAYLFHSSALVMLPLYFLGYIKGHITKKVGFIVILIYILLFIISPYFLPYLNDFIAKNFDRYDVYQGGSVVGTGIGIVYSSILFIVVLFYEKFQIKEITLVFRIAIISFMFIPLSFLIQIIGRVGMYFEPATFIAYPIILKNIKKEYQRVIFVSSLLLMTGYIFFQFFNSELWQEAFGTYHTIFSAPKE